MAPKRQEPFLIKQAITPITYELTLPAFWKIHPVFHTALLTPYHQNNVHRPGQPLPPPEIIQGEEEYKVESIITHQVNHQGLQYLIKWKGYGHQENKWIHADKLSRHASNLIAEYQATHGPISLPNPS